jgi:hypothetical protein
MDVPNVARGVVLSLLCSVALFVINYLVFSSVGTDYFLSQLILSEHDDVYSFSNLVLPRLISGTVLSSSLLLFNFYLFFCCSRSTSPIEKSLCFIVAAMLFAIPSVLAMGDPTHLSTFKPASLLLFHLAVGGLLVWRLTVVVSGR